MRHCQDSLLADCFSRVCPFPPPPHPPPPPPPLPPRELMIERIPSRCFFISKATGASQCSCWVGASYVRSQRYECTDH
jgi:hypothetical protein